MRKHTLMMSDGKLTQPGVKINEKTWQDFRQYVLTRHDGIRGHLRSEVEKALTEWIRAYEGGDTYDRLNRIESDVADIKAALSEGDSGGGNDSISKTTENRIDDIMADIQDRADQLDTKRVHEDDIEAAIERNAGASWKTVQRYKKLLQNQRQIFPKPDDEDLYFVNAEAFVAYVEGAVPTDDADEIADTYGFEWWQEQLPEAMRDGGKGFE